MAAPNDDYSEFYDPENGTLHLPPGHRARIIEIEPVEADEPNDDFDAPDLDHDDWDDE